MEDTKDRHHKWVATSKDLVAAIRELILIAIVALLLLWPKLINGRLKEAGFTQADVMGLHWERQMEEAAAKTGEAQQRVEVVQERIDSVLEGLQKISNRSDDPAVKATAAELKTVLDGSRQSALIAQRNLKSGMRIQERILFDAPASQRTGDKGAWGIVVSSDQLLPEARYEEARAYKLGYKSAALYEQGKWYRTVITFNDKEEAQSALRAVRTNLRETAYVVNLSEWCTEARRNAATGIYVCEGR